jgi:3-hydroxybutyryl-CoA dehydratase
MTAEISAIRAGFRTEHRYKISMAVYEQFLLAFGDTNRLHTEHAFARSRGFPEVVMHGVILNGFISHFIGVHFPGDGALLQSVSTQFKSPCHLGDEISIEATVAHVSEAVRVLTVEMVLINLTRGRVAAKAKVQVGVP